MYLQNNDDLISDIQKVGCLYLSILRLVELVTNITFTVNQVNDIWTEAKKLKYIDTNNDMVEPDKMLKMIKNEYGYKPIIFSIGLEEKGNTVYWQWVSKAKTITTKYKIEMLKTTGQVGTHFILCDIDNNVLFDSYSFKDYESKHVGRYHLYSFWS